MLTHRVGRRWRAVPARPSPRSRLPSQPPPAAVFRGQRRAVLPDVPALLRPGAGRALQHCVVRAADHVGGAGGRVGWWGGSRESHVRRGAQRCIASLANAAAATAAAAPQCAALPARSSAPNACLPAPPLLSRCATCGLASLCTCWATRTCTPTTWSRSSSRCARGGACGPAWVRGVDAPAPTCAQTNSLALTFPLPSWAPAPPPYVRRTRHAPSLACESTLPSETSTRSPLMTLSWRGTSRTARSRCRWRCEPRPQRA